MSLKRNVTVPDGHGSSSCSSEGSSAAIDRSSDTQPRARVQAELLGQQRAGGLEGAEGLGLTTAAVERDHPLGEEVLPQGVGGAEGLELGHDVGVAAELELGVDARFEEGEAQLGQAGALHEHDRQVAEVGQGIAPPAGQRLAVEVDGLGRVVGRQVPGPGPKASTRRTSTDASPASW